MKMITKPYECQWHDAPSIAIAIQICVHKESIRLNCFSELLSVLKFVTKFITKGNTDK